MQKNVAPSGRPNQQSAANPTKRRPGRPRTRPPVRRITLELDAQLAEQIEQFARDVHMSLTEVIQNILRQHEHEY